MLLYTTSYTSINFNFHPRFRMDKPQWKQKISSKTNISFYYILQQPHCIENVCQKELYVHIYFIQNTSLASNKTYVMTVLQWFYKTWPALVKKKIIIFTRGPI